MKYIKIFLEKTKQNKRNIIAMNAIKIFQKMKKKLVEYRKNYYIRPKI